MFEPGHLHIIRAALQPSDHTYDIDIHYDIRQDAKDGAVVHFIVEGQIQGKDFKDEFELLRDKAYNFASVISRITIKHGLPNSDCLPLTEHKQYDEMFEDIRERLKVKSGEPVKPEHLQ